MSVIYSLLPRHDHLQKKDASGFISKPKPADTVQAFFVNLQTEDDSFEPSSKKKKLSEVSSSGKISNQSNLFTAIPACFPKYSGSRPTSCASKLSDSTSIMSSSSSSTTIQILQNTQFLLNASIAGSTWSKYKSALNVFTAFASTLGFIPIWPLESGIIRQFTIYCLSSKKLAPASVESYLSALRFFHLLKGLKPPPLLQDDLVKLFLRGARNISLPSPSHQKRRAVTLPILLLLRKKITLSVWSNFLKTAFWALFSLAFFGSCRMGELVSISRTEFDSLSTLRLRDILDRSTSLLVHLKCPKSGKPGGEFIDVFPFNHADLCPVLALRSHMSNFQAKNISPDLPIFLDDNGYLFTIDYVNQALKKLLESSFDFSIDSISAHSFRAGIPSELQRSPELLSNQDVQGWGRWNSEAFQRYEKLGLYEKKNIFNKISEVLQSNLP